MMRPKSSRFWIIFTAFQLVILISHGARRIDVSKRMATTLAELKARRSTDDSGMPKPEVALGLHGEQLDAVDSVPTAEGGRQTKYQETYQGLALEGESVVLETEVDGSYSGSVFGQLVDDVAEDLPSVEPKISAAEAFEIAIKAEEDHPNDVLFDERTDARLIVMVEETGDPESVTPVLTWEVNYRVEMEETLSRPFYLIDAISGGVIRSWQGMSTYTIARNLKRKRRGLGENNLTKRRNVRGDLRRRRRANIAEISGTGGNEKIGKYVYGEERPRLKVSRLDERMCALENPHVLVINMNYSTMQTSFKAYQFECDQGSGDTVNGGYSPLNDVYFHCSMVHEMYLKVFRRPPLGRKRITARVHYGKGEARAFWNGLFVTFGDGDDSLYPMSSLDVVSHEIAHGFSEQHSRLGFSGQAGALGESFSDMAGEAADFYYADVDWKSGASITKGREAIRFMEEPTKDGMSISHNDDYCPGMDPHLAGGVFNKVFHRLSNKPGWTPLKTFHVFGTANRIYWRTDATFAGAACGVVKAARDLWNKTSDTDDIVDSFRQVGVVPCEDRPVGIATMHNLRSFPKKYIMFRWKPPKGVRNLAFDLINHMELNPVEMDLYVQTPEYKVNSHGMVGNSKRFHITGPSRSVHSVVIEGTEPFIKASLWLSSNDKYLAKDLSSTEPEGKHDIPIKIPERIANSRFSVGVRVAAKVSFPESMSLIFLESRRTGADPFFFSHTVTVGPFRQFTLCKPKAGTYILTLYGPFEGVEVVIAYLHTMERLTPRKGKPKSSTGNKNENSVTRN